MDPQVFSPLSQTDPLPYLFAAYSLGLIGIIGYGLFLMLQRRKLRQLLQACKEEAL